MQILHSSFSVAKHKKKSGRIHVISENCRNFTQGMLRQPAPEQPNIRFYRN